MSIAWNESLALLWMLFLDPRTGVLIGLLAVAALTDLRSRRIPNLLVFGGAVFAILYNGFFPYYRNENGWLLALGGLGVGLLVFMPFYLLRAMGAGDVKLMAMVGAFLGPWGALHAALYSLLAGGLLGMIIISYRGVIGRTIRNLGFMAKGTALALSTGTMGFGAPSGPSTGVMPYGVAVALGTVVYVSLKHLRIV